MKPQRREDQPSTTRVVTEEVFRQMGESPHSLPGKYKRATTGRGVRKVERPEGIIPKTISAPVWAGADTWHCPSSGHEKSRLDIVTSAHSQVHHKELLVKVVLGKRKYVNIEAPRATEGVGCFGYDNPIANLCFFKGQNGACIVGNIHRVSRGTALQAI